MKNTLKQELREKAKNHKITMGVLSLKNNINGKQYIQGSLNLEALVNKMKFLLNSGLFTHNTSLQKDWVQYGAEVFSFDFAVILEPQENKYINERQEILKAEQAFISTIETELY
ncbi:GIY-YIG nuclease family protein [Chryseobacterium sp. PMSZPI]|uniref:GIY-YIG nuclease family protein n=1 Tax=Chryseobacterium sp. PMSZPI TaxID=1033900 RepID=UPI000C33F39D|nr:GIY-YIG nuclease family protein [Chryseobacterium sp. PMSZPI]PKF73596.1 LuxR family transcriptional regulator [Chryseobacterium sp. PMSZPI]